MKKEILAEGVELILGDCLEVLPTLGRFDAVVTDQPYGIGQGSGMGGGGIRLAGDPSRYENGDWDIHRPSAEVFRLMLLRADLHIIWGGNYFTDLVPQAGKWLFWDKCQTMPSYSDGELAWTTLPGDAVKQFTYNGNGMQAKEKGRVHPTQKPEGVMKWCLGFMPDAQTILDPFMGSGTTGVAAVKLGRKFTGIEIDPGYFDIACRRIAAALKEPDLFVEPPKPIKQEVLL